MLPTANPKKYNCLRNNFLKGSTAAGRAKVHGIAFSLADKAVIIAGSLSIADFWQE